MYGTGHRFGLGEQAAPDDASGYVDPMLSSTDLTPTVVDTETYVSPGPDGTLPAETVTVQSVPQVLPTLTVTAPAPTAATPLSPTVIAAFVIGIYLLSRSRR